MKPLSEKGRRQILPEPLAEQVRRVNWTEALVKLEGFKNLPDGWDGDDTHPASRSSIDDLLAIINALPNDVPAPAPYLERDGEAGLFWRLHDGSVLDLSCPGRSKVMSYYGRIGRFGGEEFLFDGPIGDPPWVDEIVRVIGKR